MKRNIIVLILAVLFTAQATAIEEPQYTVLYKNDNIEYRQYESYLVAETKITDKNSRDEAANEGFRRLFKYITGANTSQSKIAMTAPVQQTKLSEEIAMTAPVQQVESEDGWRIAFMMPSKFSLIDAPIPEDDRITVYEVPGRLMAVIRYSGRWTQSNIDKHEKILIDHITEKNITTFGNIEFAAYNAPFTLPFMRRNELMIEMGQLPN